MDIQKLSINTIINALETLGNDDLPLFNEKDLASFSQALNHFNALVEPSPDNRLLKDI